MHLTPDELLDLAEGTRSAAAEPHLASCEACRRQVAELRAVLAEVSEVQVPEPSPLFWDHLSARVRQAVAAEQAPRRQGWRAGGWSWGLASALSVAVAVLAVATTLRPSVERAREVPAAVTATVPPAETAAAAEDPSLVLLADLAGELEWDTVAAGMASTMGGADGVLGDLTAEERAELRRLLDEAMAGKGA